MKKYCTTHYGTYEEAEGCLYCPIKAAKQVIKAFQMTPSRRWSNVEWPSWLHEAWNKNLTDPGCLFPSLSTGDPQGSLVLNTRKAFPELVNWNDYIVCGDTGELALCDAKTFKDTYECAYNEFELVPS